MKTETSIRRMAGTEPRMNQIIAKKIAVREGISIDQARKFMYARKAADNQGINLTFDKWMKRNINFNVTAEGNDIEEGDFDNFLNKKRFKRINKAILTGGLSEIARNKQIKRHKNLLKKMANPRFMANPKNAIRVKNAVERLVKGIDGKNRAIVRANIAIARAQNTAYNRNRNANYPFDDFSDFNADGNQQPSGGVVATIKKYKWLLLAGGIAAFLFLTPQGKKLIAKAY